MASFEWPGSSGGGGGGSVDSVTASAPLASSGGANPNISIPLSSSTTSGYLSSTDWNSFNNKLNSIPDIQSFFVNGAGNDSTALPNRIDLPYLTISGAMSAISDTTVINQIVLQSPGSFSVDGLVMLANVFIFGINSTMSSIDFGTAGVVLDSTTWMPGNVIGGFVDVNIIGQNPPYTIQTYPSTTLYLVGCFTNTALTFDGMASGSQPIIQIQDTFANSGDINVIDTSWIAVNYSNLGSNIYFTSTSSTQVAYMLNCSSIGNFTVTDSGAAAQAYLLGGSYLNISINGADAAVLATNTLPAESSISNSGGLLVRGSDAFGLGYTPGNPSNWAGSPTVLQDAIDRIAAVVGGVVPIP
jgi:hypothetical protein